MGQEISMAPSSTPATARDESVLQAVTLSGLSFPLGRLKVRLYLATASAVPPGVPREAWLDTGAPLTVIPFHVQQQGLRWQAIPGIRATWAGQPCQLGRIDVWLPIDQPPYLHGPLSVLAKFPQSDPPGDLVPSLLGLEFFLTHQAECHLLLPPQHGIIQLP
jgi:hypothetical protein